MYLLIYSFLSVFIQKFFHLLTFFCMHGMHDMHARMDACMYVLYCTVLYRTVLCCTILYCTVLYCTVLYCTVLYRLVLYWTMLYGTVVFGDVIQCNVM